MIDKEWLIKYLSHHDFFDEEILEVKHKERGTTYLVESVAANATNERDGELLVIYIGEEDNKYWARNIDEFCDGRFEVVE